MGRLTVLGNRVQSLSPSRVRPAARRDDEVARFYHSREWRETAERVKKRDGYRCTDPNCKTPGRGYGGRVICDHIVARREGGGDGDSNLRTLCPACDALRHVEKGAEPAAR